MNTLRQLVRNTLIGGLLFLIPLVFVVVVVGKAFQIMKVVATPLGKLISIESFAGFAVVEILTVFIMILSCLLVGMLARSPWGKKLNEKLDAILLQMIPGYAWVKSVAGGIGGEDADEVLKPVLVRFDDQFQLALEVPSSRSDYDIFHIEKLKNMQTVTRSMDPRAVDWRAIDSSWSRDRDPQRLANQGSEGLSRPVGYTPTDKPIAER